jgi:carbonic anhydrase
VKKLLQGIVDFHQKIRPGIRDTFARLALGQSPDALLIACSDSRVAPNLFASTEPGDVFVIRNPGNLIAPSGKTGLSTSDEGEAAAIEFALLRLNVSDIILCGHSECGAMRILLDDKKDADAPHLYSWIRHAKGALKRVQAGERMKAPLALHNHISQFNVLQQLENLRSYAVVQERLDAGKLRLHGWYFDLAQAELLAYDEARGEFVVIDEHEAGRMLARIEGLPMKLPKTP